MEALSTEGGSGATGRVWVCFGVWPPALDARHHQDCFRGVSYVFSRGIPINQDYEPFLVGNPNLNLHLPLLLGRGDTPKICLWHPFLFPMNISPLNFANLACSR